MNQEIIMVTDRSGSMDELTSAVIAAFNHFLTSQSAAGNKEALVTHVLFGSEVEQLYAGMPLYAVPMLTTAKYHIEGMTALYDAIGFTLRDQTARIENENWADAVTVAILTDGAENDSRYFTQQEVRAMVHERQRAGWKFIFLGANQSAVLSADQLGIDPDYVSEFTADPEGIEMAYRQIGQAVLAICHDKGPT
jgi:hypothetical protein